MGDELEVMEITMVQITVQTMVQTTVQTIDDLAVSEMVRTMIRRMVHLLHEEAVHHLLDLANDDQINEIAQTDEEIKKCLHMSTLLKLAIRSYISCLVVRNRMILRSIYEVRPCMVVSLSCYSMGPIRYVHLMIDSLVILSDDDVCDHLMMNVISLLVRRVMCIYHHPIVINIKPTICMMSRMDMQRI